MEKQDENVDDALIPDLASLEEYGIFFHTYAKVKVYNSKTKFKSEIPGPRRSLRAFARKNAYFCLFNRPVWISIL